MCDLIVCNNFGQENLLRIAVNAERWLPQLEPFYVARHLLPREQKKAFHRSRGCSGRVAAAQADTPPPGTGHRGSAPPRIPASRRGGAAPYAAGNQPGDRNVCFPHRWTAWKCQLEMFYSRVSG